MAEKTYFTLNAMQKKSKIFISMLNNTFKEHCQTIKSLKYDLNNKELETFAEISRKACDTDDDGVYLLFVYLSRSSTKLAEKMSVKEVESLLQEAIDKLVKIYPSGKAIK